jgi:hypothetical protein
MPVSTRTPLPLASTLFSALLLALTACPADPGDTEGDESTGATVGTITSATTDASSTGAPTSEPDSTSADSTGGDGTTDASASSTGDATTGEPTECPVADSCEVSAADFCWYVADASAAHQIGEPYAGLLQGMCRASPACQTCWNLANYCVQLADDASTCEGLAAECGCQAKAFGLL